MAEIQGAPRSLPSVRYALIVGIDAVDLEVELCAEVQTAVEPLIAAGTAITAQWPAPQDKDRNR